MKKLLLALCCTFVLGSAADAGPVLDRLKARRQAVAQARASGQGVWLAVRVGWPLQVRLLVLPEARRPR